MGLLKKSPKERYAALSNQLTKLENLFNNGANDLTEKQNKKLITQMVNLNDKISVLLPEAMKDDGPGANP